MEQRTASLSEQVDELRRELGVRERCYPKWIQEGKLSRTDARDRLERLRAALHTVQKVENLNAPQGELDTGTSPGLSTTPGQDGVTSTGDSTPGDVPF